MPTSDGRLATPPVRNPLTAFISRAEDICSVYRSGGVYPVRVDLSNSADVVTAPRSAELSNIAFSEVVKGLELFGDDIVPVYNLLSQLMGHKYAFYWDDTKRENLIVDVDKFELLPEGL